MNTLQTKQIQLNKLEIGKIYRIKTANNQTDFITYLGGDTIMLKDGSFSFLEETDIVYTFPFPELFINMYLN